LLTAAIRNAYAEDFERVDPAEDTQAKIVDAFRRYERRSQTDRMVMLFLGLCREAGIPDRDAPRKRAMQPPAREQSKPASGSRPATRAGPRQPPSQRHERVSQAAPSSQLFGITESDIAVLDDADFDEVWAALGKVARARARAHADNGAQPQEPPGHEGNED